MALPEDDLLSRIKSLPELDLDELLREVGQHLYKNNLEHLIDNAFQMDDQTEEIHDLEQQVEELETECDEYKDTLNEIWSLSMVEDIEEGSEDEAEKLRKVLDDINNKAQ